MRVRCEIDIDLETGAYEMRVRNVSEPGERMDYGRIQQALRRVIEDTTQRQPIAQLWSAYAAQKGGATTASAQ